jgi:hypothetical protein
MPVINGFERLNFQAVATIYLWFKASFPDDGITMSL